MKGIFPGSFDPPTRGHLDLIRRAASMMDHLTICVMVNISKAGTIPTEERVRMLEKACRDIPNVSVDRWDGLLADYMRRQEPGTAVIRGVRSSAEFEQERNAAAVNRSGCGTCIPPADLPGTGWTACLPLPCGKLQLSAGITVS